MTKQEQRAMSVMMNYVRPDNIELSQTELRSINKVKSVSKDEIKLQKMKALFNKWDNTDKKYIPGEKLGTILQSLR